MIVFSNLNYWAVLVGGLFYMAFGALYYSPILFGPAWLKLNQVKDSQLKRPVNYAGSVLVAFLSSLFMSILAHAEGTGSLGEGLALGLLIALVVALVYLKNALFGLMVRKVYAIAIGDHLISFAVLGMLHALWK